nr:MAG TPA: hypothetical protein [Caudoviricetes sp.]
MQSVNHSIVYCYNYTIAYPIIRLLIVYNVDIKLNTKNNLNNSVRYDKI